MFRACQLGQYYAQIIEPHDKNNRGAFRLIHSGLELSNINLKRTMFPYQFGSDWLST